MSESALEGLEPSPVWNRFSELTRIPRPPKEESEARAHVVAWADARGLDARIDAAGNVVVAVPPSPGRERAPTVVLQSHLDMVCERDPGSPYDPRQGLIHVVVDGDWVAAEGTTLGADNGIGVAAAMAAAEDPKVVHGSLELLFTVSEEQGLTGAKELDPSLVTGRLLLNLDGTSDDALTVGCAGSAHTFLRPRTKPEQAPPSHIALELVLSGARGGHSGGDIASGRANAIKALGRVLATAHERSRFLLAAFDGGVSRNAIPRDARAIVVLDPTSEGAFRTAAEATLTALRQQYAGSDPALDLRIAAAYASSAWSDDGTTHVLDLVTALPTGVIAMSPNVPGTVETSTSLTVATTADGALTLASMTRSSNPQALDDVVETIAALSRLADAELKVIRSYAPWRPDLESELLRIASGTFERAFGIEPKLEIVHGGLECAVIGEKLPGVEMISIGPEIVGPHAPGERLSVPGTQRFYRLLAALLDDLSR